MTWYQVIEYAYSHWFSKSAEQVFGCVLCAPGCFSLFRGKVLMDQKIMQNFSSQANNAYEHTQYDKGMQKLHKGFDLFIINGTTVGEDRWLCALILKAGYKVEYCEASSAFTHCPGNFKDFCKQRTRWIPSDIANTLDLIRNWWPTRNLCNNISFLYILYQIMLMVTILLAPGTVFLVLLIAMIDYLSFDFWMSITINILPIFIFVITCFFAKSDKKVVQLIGLINCACLIFQFYFHQILVAEILSGFYIVITVVIMMGAALRLMDGLDIESLSFVLGIAFCSLIALAACLRPGEMHCFFPGIIIYLVMIPSKNIVVFLYSVINLNTLSWGTREVTVIQNY